MSFVFVVCVCWFVVVVVERVVMFVVVAFVCYVFGGLSVLELLWGVFA